MDITKKVNVEFNTNALEAANNLDKIVNSSKAAEVASKNLMKSIYELNKGYFQLIDVAAKLPNALLKLSVVPPMFKELVDGAAKFNKSLYDLSRSAQATGQSFSSLEQSIKDISNSTKLSMQDASKLITQLNKQNKGIKLTGEEYTKFAKKVTDEFGPAIEDAAEAMSLLQKVQNEGIDTDVFKKAGTLSGQALQKYVNDIGMAAKFTAYEMGELQRVMASKGAMPQSKEQERLKQLKESMANINKVTEDIAIKWGQQMGPTIAWVSDKVADMLKYVKEISDSPMTKYVLGGAAVAGAAVAGSKMINVVGGTAQTIKGGYDGFRKGGIGGALGALLTGSSAKQMEINAQTVIVNAKEQKGDNKNSILDDVSDISFRKSKLGRFGRKANLGLRKFARPASKLLGKANALESGLLGTTASKALGGAGLLNIILGGVEEAFKDSAKEGFASKNKSGNIFNSWNPFAVLGNAGAATMDMAKMSYGSAKQALGFGYSDEHLDESKERRKKLLAEGANDPEALKRKQINMLQAAADKAARSGNTSAAESIKKDIEKLNNTLTTTAQTIAAAVPKGTGNENDAKKNAIIEDINTTYESIKNNNSVINSYIKERIEYEATYNNDLSRANDSFEEMKTGLQVQLNLAKERLKIYKELSTATNDEDRQKKMIEYQKQGNDVLAMAKQINTDILNGKVKEKQYEKELLDVTKELKNVDLNRADILKGRLALGDSEIALSEANLNLTKSMYLGVGPTIDAQISLVNSIEKQIALADQQIAIQKDVLSKNENNIEAQQKLNEYQAKRVGLVTKELEVTKGLREGYLDAMAAFDGAAGAFSKIILKKDQGFGQMARTMGVIGGATTGLFGQGAAGPIAQRQAGTGTLQYNANASTQLWKEAGLDVGPAMGRIGTAQAVNAAGALGAVEQAGGLKRSGVNVGNIQIKNNEMYNAVKEGAKDGTREGVGRAMGTGGIEGGGTTISSTTTETKRKSIEEKEAIISKGMTDAYKKINQDKSGGRNITNIGIGSGRTNAIKAENEKEALKLQKDQLKESKKQTKTQERSLKLNEQSSVESLSGNLLGGNNLLGGGGKGIFSQPLESTISQMFGGVLGMASGGQVPGTGNTDSVPSLLTPGEMVVNKFATRKFAPLLVAINKNRFNQGGLVPPSNLGGGGGGMGFVSPVINVKGDTRNSIMRDVSNKLGHTLNRMFIPSGSTGRIHW